MYTWDSRLIGLVQLLFYSYHLLKHSGDNKAERLPTVKLLTFKLEGGRPGTLALPRGTCNIPLPPTIMTASESVQICWCQGF